MNYFYKVEMTIDEEKAISDGVKLAGLYAAIDSCFKEDKIYKEVSGKLVTYYTDDKEKNGMISACVLSLYDSPMRPYLTSLVWYNKLLDNVENVLEVLKDG